MVWAGRLRGGGNKTTNTFMIKAIGLALVAAGIVLIILGVNESNSISSSFARAFTGTPNNKTLWLMGGGIVSLIVGTGMAFIGPGKFHR